MAATRKRKSVSADSLFNGNVLAQVHSAIDSLLEVHGPEITASLEESDTHGIKVQISLDIDASESAPSIDVNLSFTPRHVKDRRSIQCTDPNQYEFAVFTPEQVGAMNAEKARKEAEDEANSDESEKPKRGRKAKSESEESTDA